MNSSRQAWRDWQYPNVSGFWDEAVADSGLPRHHWRPLARALVGMGKRQFRQRWEVGRQIIQNNGVAYNVYGDAMGSERPWPLDPIPFVISEEDWAFLEPAMAQRATLLNALLVDLYGPQTLLAENHLPAELVHANPNFLRPCCGTPSPGGIRLNLLACDIARSPDGRWWVLADRTQAPSGVGYALENRMVTARTLPGVFSQCSVRQLGTFFESLRAGLLSLAPGRKRIILLTPGPFNETYFEHSYLAKHWGFPLVEGADLTVRDQKLFLKTLGGLEQVDLVLRRQDDQFCDPLELREDSLLGVAGLMGAVRAGNVVIANALGSGLVETPALMAFLPYLSQKLLGQSLLMPSLATWWTGQPLPRQTVLANLPQLVVKPTYPQFGLHPVFCGELKPDELQELSHSISANPAAFVAQEQVALSVAPVWANNEVSARHVVLRLFAAWDGEKYVVMPGGLTRVSKSPSSLVVAIQQGGESKDTWVLGGTSEEASPKPLPKAAFRPIARELPSRVADNLYWLGRYTERVECLVRLLRTLLPSLSSEEDYGRNVSLDTAIQVMVGYEWLTKDTLRSSLASQHWQVERLLFSMISDATGSGRLGWNLKQVRRLSWQVKDRLSSDTWRVLQRLESTFQAAPPATPDQRLTFFLGLMDQAIISLSAFSGLLMESTTRGQGWRFLDIGRRVERGLQMTELLRHGLAAAAHHADPFLEFLLQVADSTITYRTRYMTLLRADLVLDLLLVDETNPRSVCFQLDQLHDHIARLPGHHPEEEAILMQATKSLSAEDLQTLSLPEGGRRKALNTRLEELEALLITLSDGLSGTYFSHIHSTRLLQASYPR